MIRNDLRILRYLRSARLSSTHWTHVTPKTLADRDEKETTEEKAKEMSPEDRATWLAICRTNPRLSFPISRRRPSTQGPRQTKSTVAKSKRWSHPTGALVGRRFNSRRAKAHHHTELHREQRACPAALGVGSLMQMMQQMKMRIKSHGNQAGLNW